MQTSLFSPGHKPITLRPYQQAAVDAAYAYLRAREDNPCIVLPTGAGKTPVIATICRDAVKQWGGRVLVLAHVKELLKQAADKLAAMCPGISVGLYSAGLGRKDTRQSVIVAGIQSIYAKACDLDPFDLVLVDEAHLIPPDGDGMYRRFLADLKVVNPRVRVTGLTATPFRMKSGLICSADGMLNAICYEIGVRELIADGYLSPLVSKQGATRVDLSQVHVHGGEFVAEEAAAAFDVDDVVGPACREIVDFMASDQRKSCLVFACSVEHAGHVADELRRLDPGARAEVVTGETSPADRDRFIREFSVFGFRFSVGNSSLKTESLKTENSRNIKYLVNVNVLTTGFDAPNVDCVALLRPTNSPGLYYQMVGRGFRLHPGKTNCLVLDFGGNVLRHGPVDKIEVRDSRTANRQSGDGPAKECPQCKSLIGAAYCVCPDCGYAFPAEAKPQHDPTAANAGVLSGQVSTSASQVSKVFYSVHTKRGAAEDDPRTLRVDYVLAGGFDTKSEWVCIEHPEGSFPRRKAESWWSARSPDPFPRSVEEAVEVADFGGVAATLEITVRSVSGEKFDRIVDYKLGPMPSEAAVSRRATEHAQDDDFTTGYRQPEALADDDIPF